MTSSIIYHSIENVKHNLPGIYRFSSPKDRQFYNKLWLNVDRLSACLAVVTTFKIFPVINNIDNVLICGLVAGICVTLSEGGKYLPGRLGSFFNNNIVYVILHSIWHIGIFHCSYILANFPGKSLLATVLSF